MLDIYVAEIKNIIGADNVSEGEIMAPHMSMKVGGAADLFVTPDDVVKLSELVAYLNSNDIPYYVLGNGSNVIIRDEGYRGVIIYTRAKLNSARVEGERIIADAGISLKEIAEMACSASLTGFEFASGIPGSLGGAVTMNAGAYDGEMKDVLESVNVIDRTGRVLTIAAEEADLSYRHSIFSDGDYIITGAVIRLSPGDMEAIQARMDDLNARRAEKQPLEYPSCGSTFKRPEGYYAGKLIMDAGLAGARVGGASVSTKHCGFVVNDQGGSASDVLGVIFLVQEAVREQFGVSLECEVRVL